MAETVSVSERGKELASLASLNLCICRIKDSLNSIRTSFFYIGQKFAQVKEECLFRFGGYSDIYDFSEKTFGFKSTLTKNLIGVYDAFKDKNGELKTSFSDVPSSRLIELLPLKDDEGLCEDLKALPVQSIKSAKKAFDSIKESSSEIKQLVRECLPYLLKGFSDAGLSVSDSSVVPDVSSFGLGCSVHLSVAEFKGLIFKVFTRESKLTCTFSSDHGWYQGLTGEYFSLGDDLDKTLSAPVKKLLKAALKNKADDDKRKAEFRASQKAEKEAVKKWVAPTKEGIPAYLSNPDNWLYCTYLGFYSVYSLSHCSQVFRFDFKVEGKAVSLYFIFDKKGVLDGSGVVPFGLDQLSNCIYPDSFGKEGF